MSRQVLIESGHRCAVCGDSCPLERAHIIPFCDSEDHALENLICLCANCHERADKERWGERTLREYKRRPWVLRKYTDCAAAQPNMTRVQISIDLKYEDCDQRSKSHLQHALAGFLGIPPEYVTVISVTEGSVRIVVLLPEVEAERLIRAYEMKDPTLPEHLAAFSLLGIHRDIENREPIRIRRGQKMRTDESLIFAQSPFITIGSNQFLCRIPVRYRDTAMLEFVKEVDTSHGETYTSHIPIFHSDGTKLAVVKGRQIYKTKDGEKAGVTLDYIPDGTICKINGKPAFEIRRQGAAALKMDAELHTFDGAFLRWSETDLSGLLTIENDSLRLGGSMFTRCSFQGVVGIQIGDATTPFPACVKMAFVK
ncbi:MAG: HNH endonuclease signature motif containing protein [Planctomycetia bacterium]|nr:HNH endonuclease signature motif containing protein [Planctomycetia bacterium]